MMLESWSAFFHGAAVQPAGWVFVTGFGAEARNCATEIAGVPSAAALTVVSCEGLTESLEAPVTVGLKQWHNANSASATKALGFVTGPISTFPSQLRPPH
jgi:hypothetical protein